MGQSVKLGFSGNKKLSLYDKILDVIVINIKDRTLHVKGFRIYFPYWKTGEIGLRDR
jgi:hypothetical protein